MFIIVFMRSPRYIFTISSLHIVEAYDLKLPFNESSGGTAILPQKALSAVRSRIENTEQQIALSKKSLLNTILGNLGFLR